MIVYITSFSSAKTYLYAIIILIKKLKSMLIDKPKSVINRAVDILNAGGIISFPTETVYALAANPNDISAISRLYQIKNRNVNKPFAILVDSIAMIEEVAILDKRAYILLEKFTPGPLTIVLKLKESVKYAAMISGNNNTIGIRIPHHNLALEIIKTVGRPIVATSANISNNNSSITAQEVESIFGSQIDMIIDGGRSEIGIGSTVVDLSTDKIILLREGSISFKEILNLLP
ncbi:Translation factor (SUA5) [Rickettsiales bacterium Ac37b]|nr:Translation factor (SUA5) [Rickettsiales bacterium Ac37b]